MLEILFTQSAAGGLKFARNYGKGEYKSKTVHFAVMNGGNSLSEAEIESHRKIVEERERIKWEEAVPLGIGNNDVVALSFGLSVGDISEDIPGERRRQQFNQQMSIYPEFSNTNKTQKLFKKMQKSLERVIEAVKANQPVRLWYSDNPDELCGLYHLIYIIDKINSNCVIFTVKLPDTYIREDGTIVRYNGWGEVPPEDWHLHFKTEKVSQPFKILCTSNWLRLKKDNAPVRGILNGIMQSLPENIYDSFIIKEIKEMNTQFRQAEVIGRVLGKYQLCIGDAFIAQRMENMIENGMLTVVQQAEADRPVYHRIVERNI